MSNQRNAERDAIIDRETIAFETEFVKGNEHMCEIASHWLERAVPTEQRVAELEDTLRRIMKILEPDAKPYRPAAYAYHEAVKALKGLESEDRGE